MTEPRKIRLSAIYAGRRIDLVRRGDAQLLKLLVAADGEWVTPKEAGLLGLTLSRHAAWLRRDFSLPVVSKCVQHGTRFFNKHRLAAPVLIDGGSHVS